MKGHRFNLLFVSGMAAVLMLTGCGGHPLVAPAAVAPPTDFRPPSGRNSTTGELTDFRSTVERNSTAQTPVVYRTENVTRINDFGRRLEVTTTTGSLTTTRTAAGWRIDWTFR